jgi:transcriptional regulator with XRE-family HTH domain
LTTTSGRREQIAASLQDKEYRDLFVAEEIATGLPFQLRAMRQARGWSQQELAERAGMTQEGISRLESLNYGRFTLTTLKRLASAFDVALVVRFEPFGRLVDWAANMSPEDLAVPAFTHDPGVAVDTTATEPVPAGRQDRVRFLADARPPAEANGAEERMVEPHGD